MLTLAGSFILSNLHMRASRERILRIQEKKLRFMLLHAYHHSRFYHDLYSSMGMSASDLKTTPIEKIPTVDKDIIMENFDRVITRKDVTKEEVLDFLDKNRDPQALFKKSIMLYIPQVHLVRSVYLFTVNVTGIFFTRISQKLLISNSRGRKQCFLVQLTGITQV